MDRRSALLRNNVRVLGRGERPMLFAHGFGCAQQVWRHVAPAFMASHRLYLFDFVGSGGSDRSAYDPQRYRDLRGYAQDIVELCEAFDLHDACVVGHSVSAMVSMLAAAGSPRIGSLVMVCPSPCFRNDLPRYHGGFEGEQLIELLQQVQSGAAWQEPLARSVAGVANDAAIDELNASFCEMDAVVARQFAEATFLCDHRDDLRHCRLPTLVVQCRDDVLAPESVGRFVQSELPQGRLAMLSARGHSPHLTAPQELVEAIQAFQRTLDAPP